MSPIRKPSPGWYFRALSQAVCPQSSPWHLSAPWVTEHGRCWEVKKAMLKIPASSGTLPTDSLENEVPYSSSRTREKERTVSSALNPKKGLTYSLDGVAKMERVLRRKLFSLEK